jgi:hypothetical protein
MLLSRTLKRRLPDDDVHTSKHVEAVGLSITDQHYALTYITPLFDTQAPTCFDIHVPFSGIFLCPRELLESRNGYVVCHKL